MFHPILLPYEHFNINYIYIFRINLQYFGKYNTKIFPLENSSESAIKNVVRRKLQNGSTLTENENLFVVIIFKLAMSIQLILSSNSDAINHK